MSTVATSTGGVANDTVTVVGDVTWSTSSLFLLRTQCRDGLVEGAKRPQRRHLFAPSAGDGAGRRAGIRCVHAAHRAASDVHMGRVQLKRAMHSNGHVVGRLQLGCTTGGALWATREAIEGDLGLCRHVHLEMRAPVCRTWHAAASESNESAAIVCDGMRAPTWPKSA